MLVYTPFSMECEDEGWLRSLSAITAKKCDAVHPLDYIMSPDQLHSLFKTSYMNAFCLLYYTCLHYTRWLWKYICQFEIFETRRWFQTLRNASKTVLTPFYHFAVGVYKNTINIEGHVCNWVRISPARCPVLSTFSLKAPFS